MTREDHVSDETMHSEPLPEQPVPSSFSDCDTTFSSSDDPMQRHTGGTSTGKVVAIFIVLAVVVVGLIGAAAVSLTTVLNGGPSFFDRASTSISGSGGDNERVDTEDWMRDLAAPAVRESMADNCAVMVIPLYDFDGLHEENQDILNCVFLDDVEHPGTGIPFDVYAADIVGDSEVASQAAVLPPRNVEEITINGTPTQSGHEIRAFERTSSLAIYDIQDEGLVRYSVYNATPDDAEPFLQSVGLIN